MQIPNKGIIDGDWLAYTAACYADNEGFDCLEDRIAYDIRDLSSSFEDIAVAFSCSRSDNFRRDFWPLYKSNREGKPKPQFLGDAVQMIRDRIEEVIEIPRLEADDIISMMVSSGEAIGIAIDKDMRTVGGWHWNPRKEDKPVEVSEEEARNFERIQIVAGDSTDNIFGILGRGEAWAKKNLDSWNWKAILSENSIAFTTPGKRYVEKRDRIINETGIKDPTEYLSTQYRCLHLLRPDEYNKETGEITHTLPWEV
jgi:5'-3' exonuclease